MSSRPRAVILITTDEQRIDTLGAYGCKGIQTPHIDSIGQRGTRFDNMFTVSPWCMPSRCAMLTGCYPHRNGAYSNFKCPPLNPDLPNLYSVARSQGYTSAHFGKCHYSSVEYGSFAPDATTSVPSVREHYLSLGLDHLALQDDKNVSVWQYDDYSRELEAAGHLKDYREAAWHRSNGGVFSFPGPKEWHPDAWVGRKAAEYIESRSSAQPLFAWVSFSGPHYPIDPPEEYLERVDASKLPPMPRREGLWQDASRIHHESYHGSDGNGIDGCGYARNRACANFNAAYWERMRHHYLANMALIDDQVGEVLAAVRRTYGGDALIVFTSDHGDMLGTHGLWGKHNCGYDDVLRVPFLMQAPRGTDAGQINDTRRQTIDIFPTLAAAMGAEPMPVDGRLLSDEGYEFTLAEGGGFYCIGNEQHRLIRAAVPGRTEPSFEFFDLTRDPVCFENRYTDPDYADVVRELKGRVENDPAMRVIL